MRCDGWAMELGRDGRRPYRGCAQSGHERWAPCRAVARQRQEQNLAGAPSASRRRRRRRRTHARPPCSRHTALQRETRGRPARPALRRESPKGKKGGEERRGEPRSAALGRGGTGGGGDTRRGVRTGAVTRRRTGRARTRLGPAARTLPAGTSYHELMSACPLLRSETALHCCSGGAGRGRSIAVPLSPSISLLNRQPHSSRAAGHVTSHRRTLLTQHNPRAGRESARTYAGQECHMWRTSRSSPAPARRDAEVSVRVRSRVLAGRGRLCACAGQGRGSIHRACSSATDRSRTLFKLPGTSRPGPVEKFGAG